MKILKKQGINFHMQTKVEGITKNTNGASVSTSDKDGKKIILIVMLFLYLLAENLTLTI